MDNFAWYLIKFEDGGNPYICKTEKEFNRIKGKYNLVNIANNVWFAKSKQTENWFYEDLRMEQQEQM